MTITEKEGLSVLRKSWAVAELKLSYRQKKRTGVIIKSSYDAYKVFLHMWDTQLINIQEQFCALFLNSANEVLGFRLIGTGAISNTIVDIPMVFSCALLSRASGIMLGHNHPSGKMLPTKSDKHITYNMSRVAEHLNVNLLDHLIISKKEYFSFADNCIILKTN